MLRNKKGTLVPLFAVMVTAILGLGGIVTDISLSHSQRTNIKNALDQATLAGTSQLAGPTSVSNAKNLALTYLNDNLTMTIPNFTPLTLSSNGLTIQGGIYDFNNMSFTWDEVNSNINALMISYTYNSMSYLANIFMIANFQINESSTTAKRAAAKALPGTGFPLTIYSTALMDVMNSFIDLSVYSASGMDNSFWTDYTLNNASTTDIKNVIDYFQTGMGTMPPGISVNDVFAVNDGGMGGIFMELDPNILVGMTFLFSVVTPTMDNQVMADGFVIATINSITDGMSQKNIGITILPGSIDNTFGGLQVGADMTNISGTDQSYLANAYGLVQ